MWLKVIIYAPVLQHPTTETETELCLEQS